MTGGGGKRGRIHKSKKYDFPTPKSDINVTPLVDVCLVLLIIFMVITPLMSRGREVPLPKTQYHYNRKDKLQPVVAIDTEGNVWVEKERIGEPTKETLEIMKAKITEGWEKVTDPNSMGRVYLKAARDLPYGKVYPVLIAINELGVTSVDLGTNEREAK